MRDTNGANLRTTPGYENIVGVAIATNSVTVNSGSCDRKGEYYQREITMANSSSVITAMLFRRL